MHDEKPESKPTVHIEGDVKDSTVVVGDNNIVTSIRNYLFRDNQQLLITLFVLLLILVITAGIYWYSHQPRRMTGNFNIAVAQFGEITATGEIAPSLHSEQISNTLFNYLDSEFKGSTLGLTVQVSHHNMPLITEDLQAQALARRINADVVIYGNVYVAGDRAEFTPRFYVSEQAYTRELIGQNELGLPIPFNVPELGANDPVNAEFKARTEVLLNFTKALVYFSQRDFTLAENVIQATIKAANKTSQPFAGKEVIYLLDSQIQLKQKKYELAHEALDQALSINSHYARAFLARGNIFYVQALEMDFDPLLLDKALAEYKQAFSLPDQPEGAYIPIKAHTAMGNIIVVRAQQTKNPDLFLEAVGHYEYVISQYRQTKDPFLKSYASIAYFGLGAAYERQGKTKEAVDNYWNAYKLSDDKQFKERIKQQIAAAQGR